MLDQLESQYDCANAGEDLQRLLGELENLKHQHGQESSNQALEEQINRLQNQIHFIKAKCDIRP